MDSAVGPLFFITFQLHVTRRDIAREKAAAAVFTARWYRKTRNLCLPVALQSKHATRRFDDSIRRQSFREHRTFPDDPVLRRRRVSLVGKKRGARSRNINDPVNNPSPLFIPQNISGLPRARNLRLGADQNCLAVLEKGETEDANVGKSEGRRERGAKLHACKGRRILFNPATFPLVGWNESIFRGGVSGRRVKLDLKFV